MNLKYAKNENNEWWIVNHDPPIGPYNTESEAQDALEGVKRFYQEVEEDQALEDILR